MKPHARRRRTHLASAGRNRGNRGRRLRARASHRHPGPGAGAGFPRRPRASPSPCMTPTHPRRAASGTGRSSTCRGRHRAGRGRGRGIRRRVAAWFLPASHHAGLARYLGGGPPPGHGSRHYHFVVHAVDVPSLGIGADASATLLGFNLFTHRLAGARSRPSDADRRRQRRLTISSTQPAMHGHVVLPRYRLSGRGRVGGDPTASHITAPMTTTIPMRMISHTMPASVRRHRPQRRRYWVRSAPLVSCALTLSMVPLTVSDVPLRSVRSRTGWCLVDGVHGVGVDADRAVVRVCAWLNWGM